jgi:cell pole-organizing protein PopZ
MTTCTCYGINVHDATCPASDPRDLSPRPHERQAETLEQIADRVAPQGGKQAAMKAAKARAKQAAYQASRPQPEPTQEQQGAFTEYVAAREEWEGLRDDIAFANSFAEQDAARMKLRAATGRYHTARKEAERLGILEDARRLFR